MNFEHNVPNPNAQTFTTEVEAGEVDSEPAKPAAAP